MFIDIFPHVTAFFTVLPRLKCCNMLILKGLRAVAENLAFSAAADRCRFPPPRGGVWSPPAVPTHAIELVGEKLSVRWVERAKRICYTSIRKGCRNENTTGRAIFALSRPIERGASEQ